MKLYSLLVLITALSMNVIGQGTLTPIPIDSLSFEYGFYEYLPNTYDDNENDLHPLVLFLHSAG